MSRVGYSSQAANLEFYWEIQSTYNNIQNLLTILFSAGETVPILKRDGDVPVSVYYVSGNGY